MKAKFADGEYNIDGDLESLETIDEFLALLHIIGAFITIPKTTGLGKEIEAILDLEDGFAKIKITNIEWSKAPSENIS